MKWQVTIPCSLSQLFLNYVFYIFGFLFFFNNAPEELHLLPCATSDQGFTDVWIELELCRKPELKLAAVASPADDVQSARVLQCWGEDLLHWRAGRTCSICPLRQRCVCVWVWKESENSSGKEAITHDL